MNKAITLTEELASYKYTLKDIKRVQSSPFSIQQEAALTTLVLFREASGEIVIDGHGYRLHQQKAFILSPNAVVKMLIHPDCQIDYYCIRFHALQERENGQMMPAELRLSDELTVPYFDFVMDKVQEMERKLANDPTWGLMQANIIFLEIFLALMKVSINKQPSDMQHMIALTLEYMEQHYHFNITRQKLAEIAGMTADYYSRSFKKVTGKSPMEYLTEIRINKAKHSLVLSHDTFRSIAHSVGISDEFYFSRKFKATTGHSPKSYVKKIKSSERFASLKHPLTGHLVVLGIEPYAALINNIYPVTIQFRNTIAVGNEKPDLMKLMTAKPDLIMTCNIENDAESPTVKMFDQIAPTITLPFFQDWRVQLQAVASIVDKENEANVWLERYETKAETIRKQVKDQIGDETILVVGIGDGKMCIYGQRNMGAVLYGDLQLRIPKGVENIVHRQEVSLDDLFDYEPDRILLTSYKHDGTLRMDQAIRHDVNTLFANEQWLSLKAVRNRAVHFMHDSQHHYTCYTSLSHLLFMDKAQQLLMSDLSNDWT